MRFLLGLIIFAQTINTGHNRGNSGAPTWPHVHSITIDHTKVGASNSSNIPIYIGGTYSWLATTAHSGQINHTTTCCANTETVPADLIFTSDSGCLTLLSWDIPTYNATTGVIEAWVNVPTLSNTVDTVIYACTGNAAITTYQATYTSTWNSNYKGVWHFGDGTTLDLHDSTTNANTCANNNGVTATTGLLLTGGAASFTRASSMYLGCGTGSSLNITGTLQMEAIFNEPSLPNSSQIPVIFSNSGNFVNGYDLLQQPNSGLQPQWMYGQLNNASAQTTSLHSPNATVPTGGVTELVVARYDNGASNNFDFLLNNGPSSKSVSAGATGSSTSAFEIGRNPASVGFSLYWDGVLDEIRVLNVAESNDWITTQFNNMSSPATFYTVTSIR